MRAALCSVLIAAAALAPAAVQSGVPELSFRDILRLPVGPRGLELAPGLLARSGQRVRMVGYMVRQDGRTGAPGIFILAPLPVALDDEDEAQADDLPASAVHVHLPPSQAQRMLPHRPGRLAVVGTLEVGARAEADGRRSFVRLQLDETSPNPQEISDEPSR